MLCEVCMWIACWKPGGETYSTNVPLCSPHALVLGAAPDAFWELGSFLLFREREHQWRISGCETLQSCRMSKWVRRPLYKSQKAACRDYDTILKTGEPRFRSWFGRNMPYSPGPRMFELSFSSYKMKMAPYSTCVSRDWVGRSAMDKEFA